MRLFHLGWWSDQLHLWGETSEETYQIGDAEPNHLSCACQPDVLMNLLDEQGLSVNEAPETIIAWLPTVRGAAVPSSPVLEEGDGSPRHADAVSFAPWRVPTLPLDRAAVIDLCAGNPERRMFAPGQLLGNDLAYWAHVVRFAGALVAREQFLPGMQERDGIYRACWEPVVRGEETERVAALANAMPSACRALSTSDTTAPATPPRTILTNVLGDLVDCIVRMGQNGQAAASHRAPASFDSLHDQWLHALRTSDGKIQGNTNELTHLAGQLRAWRRRIEVTAGAPFRLTFRLEEPTGSGADDITQDAGSWHVRYLLQSTADPSLQIDVATAWDPDASTRRAFDRASFQPESYLLAALGQAMGVWPAIEESLKQPNPARLELDTAQAHAFLREYAPLLRQAGFGVQLPAWWKRGRTKERLSTKANAAAPDMKAKAGLSLKTIVQFDWEVALGDHVLSREELDELAEMKTPLVNLRGEWVEVDLDAIREMVDRLDRKDADRFTVRDVMQMALGAEEGPAGLPVEDISTSGQLGDLLDRLNRGDTIEPLSEPDGFEGTLRPYQKRGYAWLAFLKRWGLGACLADDMGLGKTVQALALLQRTYNDSPERSAPESNSANTSPPPSLIVCPTSVVTNWKKEANRFTPDLSVLVHHGGDRASDEGAFTEQMANRTLVVTNYALLRRDVELFRAISWDTVVLDEAQYVKNPSAQRTQAARSLTAQHRIAMTGTPVENNVGDLWSIMEIMNPGLLGSQAAFKKKFFRPIQNERDEEAMHRLKRITGPFILRREKTDPTVIDDLPEKQEMTVYTALTEEQASLYRAVVKETTAALEGEQSELDMERRGLVLSTLMQLKQICNHPAQYLHDDSQIAGRSGKLSRLEEMLEEVLAANERALIFTQFTEMGTMLKRHLQETFGREALFLHGGVKQEKRDQMVERFQEADDAPPFFLLSLKAGGTGLNLTRANHVFHYDRWWNPAVENQATDRAFRIGQTRRVQVHKFVCAGTLEERIAEMIERKKNLADQVVDAGEGWVTELSTDELKDLFRLREDAM
ncbi:MAG: DEAD/DEAH box helicase [Longimonas sp.]|uniref:DEAD/DEAH box helicase n=1 Tax=Longimonas sp. TaxID=2039626 RepID=UPI00397560E6